MMPLVYVSLCRITFLNPRLWGSARVPVDEVFIVITLHLILDGCLKVPDSLEGQLEISLQALVGSLKALNVHFLPSRGNIVREE